MSVRGHRWLTLTAALLLTALRCGVAWAADSEPVEPLNGMWKGVIVRKDRATISYYDGSRQVKTFVGQGRAVEANLSGYDSVIRTTKGTDVGADSNNHDRRIYAASSAAGLVPKDVELDEPFYGTDTLRGVPTAVVCNVYLTVLSGGGGSEGNDAAIWMELTDAAGRAGKPVKLSLPNPAYDFCFRGDVSKQWTKSERSVNLDLAANDWNGDGYTDWVVSYISAGSSASGKGNGDDAWYDNRVVTAYVDGKSLLDAAGGSGSPTVFTAETDCGYNKNIAGGKTDVVPAVSSRMAIGDVDGDGIPEVAIYYTKAGMSRVGAPYDKDGDNGFRLLRVKAADKAFESMYGSNDGSLFGNSYVKNDVTGIGIGDLDADGRGEIVLLHGNTSALHQQSRVYIDIWRWENGMTRLVSEAVVDDHKTYNVLGERSGYNTGRNGEGFSIGSYEVAVDDLDGDGRCELIWTTVCTRSGTHYLRTRVHTWPGALSGLGSYAATDIAGDKMDADYSCYSMATGVFQDPAEVTNGRTLARQVAVAWQNGTELNWGIYDYDRGTRKLTEVGKGAVQSALYAATGKENAGQNSDQVRPQLVAADFAADSLVLGEPTRIDATDNIELQYVLAAPPVHWDVLDDDYAADAFFGLAGYATKFDSTKTDQFVDQTTRTDSGSWGVGGTLTKNQTSLLTRQTVPIFEVGIDYGGKAAHANTSSTTYQTAMGVATDAHGDDQVFFTARNYTIWRYPVLYPADQRYQAVSDDEGGTVTSQQYMQFVVPVPPSAAASATGQGTGQGWSTAGSAIDWYEPPYDNHNLFTYPKYFDDLYGYPQAAAKDPNDPWRDVNGSLLYRSDPMVVGNTAPTSAALTTTKVESETDVDDISHKVGMSGFRNLNWSSYNVFDKPGGKLLSIKSKNIRLEANGDYSYQQTTTSTSSATGVEQVKLNWPGALGYKNAAGLGPEDVEFTSQAAIYTQDSGALIVGYVVSGLRNFDTVLWGADSPYNRLPDPGLLLPFRYDTSDGSPSKSVYKSHRLRGVIFAAPDTEDDAGYVSRVASGLPVEAFVSGTKMQGMFRVYNYSFVQSAAATVSVSYQRIAGLEEAPDIAKAATAVDTVQLPSVPGREGVGNNWHEAYFDWTVPGERQLGYLHFKVNYGGEQLSEDNDHGFVLVGCAPKEDFLAAAPRSTGLAAVSAGRTSAAELPNLSIGSVALRAADGRLLSNLDEAADGERIEVSCTVEMTPNGSGRAAVPAVRLFMLNGTSVVAATQIPLLRAGEPHTFELSFVKTPDAEPGSLRLLVSSPFLRAPDDPDPTDNVHVLNPSGDDGPSDSDAGGGGGCEAGAGAVGAALLLVMGLAAKGRRG